MACAWPPGPGGLAEAACAENLAILARSSRVAALAGNYLATGAVR